MLRYPVSGLRISTSTRKQERISSFSSIERSRHTLRKPKWNQVNTLRYQSRTSMNEFTGREKNLDQSAIRYSAHNYIPELGHRFNKVRLHKFRNPFRRLLTQLRLEFHLKHTMSQDFSIFIRELRKREIDPNICPTPVIARSSMFVPIVFPDEGQLLQRDTRASPGSWNVVRL